MALPTEKEGALIERVFKLIASNRMTAILCFFGYMIIKQSNGIEEMFKNLVKLEHERLKNEVRLREEELIQEKRELSYKYAIPQSDSTK